MDFFHRTTAYVAGLLDYCGATDYSGRGHKFTLACSRSDYETASALLEAGCFVYDDAVFQACLHNCTEIIDMLMENDLNNWDAGLRGACLGGHFDLVKHIVNKKPVNLEHKLYDACYGGNFFIVTYLLRKGGGCLDCGFRGACESRHPEIVKLMLSCGVHVCHNSLVTACKSGNSEIVEMVIGYRNFYMTPLGAACESGNIRIIHWMIEQGYDDWDMGLRGACHDYQVEAAGLMLWKGATCREELARFFTHPSVEMHRRAVRVLHPYTTIALRCTEEYKNALAYYHVVFLALYRKGIPMHIVRSNVLTYI